jgi:hypothetical protein
VKRLLKYCLLGIVFENLCLLAFIYAADTVLSFIIKSIFLIGIFSICFLYAKNTNFKLLAIYSIVLSLGHMIFYDFLAYTRFTGLRKDIDFGSLDYFKRTIVIVALVLTFYLIVNGICVFLRFIAKRYSRLEEMDTKTAHIKT